MKSDWVPRLRILLIILLTVVWAAPAFSDTVTVAWDPSPSPGVTGYNLYYGLSGSFTNKLGVGNQTSTAVTGLEPSLTYFFFATATDGYSESDPSTVVDYHVNTPPVAANISAQTIANQSTAITLIGTDADADPLTDTVVTGPTHGLLSGRIPNLVYTPTAGYVGPDSFTYTANDGKVDSNLATVSISVLQPPDLTAPLVAITAPANGSVASGVVTIAIGASDNVGVTGVELYLNGVLAGTTADAPASFTWDTTTAANGTWSLQAKAYDLAGNAGTSSSVSVTVQNVVPDTTPPNVNLLSPTTGSTVSGSFQIRVAASDNVAVSKVKCYVNGALIGSTTTLPAVFSWDTTKTPNGTYTVQAQAYDAAGNSTAVSAPGVVVSNAITAPDTTAPVVAIASPATGAVIWGKASLSVQATDDRGVTKVELYVDSQLVASATSGFPTFSFDTTTVANGLHTVQVKAYDAASNVGLAGIQVDVENAVKATDTTAPTVAITSPRDGATIRKNFSVTIKASDNVGVTRVEFYLDGRLYGSSTSATPTFTVIVSKLSKGAHSLVAKAYDAANNQRVSATLTVYK